MLTRHEPITQPVWSPAYQSQTPGEHVCTGFLQNCIYEIMLLVQAAIGVTRDYFNKQQSTRFLLKHLIYLRVMVSLVTDLIFYF